MVAALILGDMTNYRNPVTHQPLVVSPNSTETIVRALVAANRDGVISDYEYTMTYAEVCEIDRVPQAFGGTRVDQYDMNRWKTETR